MQVRPVPMEESRATNGARGALFAVRSRARCLLKKAHNEETMKTPCIVLAACLSICFAFSDSLARSDTEEMAISAAQAWLALVDGGNYSESWKEASAYFRGGVTQENWQSTMEAFRRPLGKVISREVMQAEELAGLPGAPDGKYVVVRFISSFEKKRSAVETVTFMLDNDGKWRAVRYFTK